MKNYLTILAFAAISFCLICGGCQSENAAKDEPTAAKQSAEKAKPAKAKAVVKAGAPTRSARSRGKWRLYDDWDIKMDFNGTEHKSILSFSRQEDKLIGQWISFWSANELKDINLEDDKLSFVQTYQGRDGQSRTSNFTGTIKGGKLSGTVSGERGEYELAGKRSRRTPRAVGNWAMKMKTGEREFNSMLVVNADEEGNLTAQWQSERGEHEITDVKYERGRLSRLTFKKKSKIHDSQWEATFEGTVRRDILSGVFKSDRGEVTAEGKLIGTSLIGNWNLEITSERGSRKQRLKVNRDMSGLYGTVVIKKVNLEGDKVSFKTVLEFGERKFEISFEGKLEDSKLTGELTTARGTRKVTGTKIVRSSRGRRTR